MGWESAPDVLTIDEAARLLRVEVRAVHEAIRGGRLRVVNFGLQTRVPKPGLLRLARGEHSTNQEEVIPLSNTENDQSLSFANAPDVLTVEETAKLCRLGRNACYEAIRTKQIPSIRIGKRLLITKWVLMQVFGLPPLAGVQMEKMDSGVV
jgi:excisionase family DNA binding protein